MLAWHGKKSCVATYDSYLKILCWKIFIMIVKYCFYVLKINSNDGLRLFETYLIKKHKFLKGCLTFLGYLLLTFNVNKEFNVKEI